MKKHAALLCSSLLIGALAPSLAAGAQADPIIWFPGPSLFNPVSGAATVTASGLGNVIVGGTSYYGGASFPENLVATNAYWSALPGYFGVNIGCGAIDGGDYIIIYGGTDGTDVTNLAFGYSPSGDGSTFFSTMSTPRAYLGYAPDRSGNAYAFGGLDDTGTPLASAEKMNPDSGTWSAIASLPAPRFDFPAVFDHTNQICIFGGYTDALSGIETSDVLRYSVSKNTWTNLASMPVPVSGSAATLGADGKFYVVGGLSGGVATTVVQVYDPAANSWSLATPLPEGLNEAAMSVDSLGRLIVMGGQDTNGNDLGDVWRSQQLGVAESAPVLTEVPATKAVYQSAYSSSIAATGNPQPVYLLVNGPAGMTVDYYTGAINWTPQGVAEIGSVPVTIAATNYAGVTDWSFDITVPNPPPVYPSNLTVVSVTDTSATVAWSPEDPSVGAVTYSFAIPHPYHSPKGSGGGVNYQVVASNITGTNFTFTGLEPSSGTTYDIKVTGPGGSIGFGFYGVSVLTTGPQGPTNLLLTGLTSTSVNLAWSPSSGPAQNPLYSPITSYAIMERIVSPPANIPTVVNLQGTSGTVTGLTPGRSHIWYVAGVDAQGVYSPLTYVYLVVGNPIPIAAQISNASSFSGGGFQLTASEGGSVLQTVLIQATTNLTDPTSWIQIGSMLPGSNPFTFVDTNASQFPARYYRLVSP